MGNYSDEILQQVRELAKLFFTPKEIAIILELDDFFGMQCLDESSPAYKAYMAGKLQSEMELRKNILQLANSGSSPAQTMALDMLKQTNLKILDR